MSAGGGRLAKGVDPGDGAARTDIRTNASRTRRRAAVGTPLPNRRPRLEAGSARRSCLCLHARTAEDPEDGGEHASGSAVSPCARRARPDQRRQRLVAAVFPASASAISTSTTSAPPVAPRKLSASSRCGGSTITGTPSRTFALRAGLSTFDLSRYMGASLTMIDHHYGHLARDGREHAIRPLDALNAPEFGPWTLGGRRNGGRRHA